MPGMFLEPFQAVRLRPQRRAFRRESPRVSGRPFWTLHEHLPPSAEWTRHPCRLIVPQRLTFVVLSSAFKDGLLWLCGAIAGGTHRFSAFQRRVQLLLDDFRRL